MKFAVDQYLKYLRSVRNASPHTLRNYESDLDQFIAFLSPPGAESPPAQDVTHLMIREFVAHLHEHNLEKSSIARKLAAIRSFFKFAVREGMGGAGIRRAWWRLPNFRKEFRRSSAPRT